MNDFMDMDNGEGIDCGRGVGWMEGSKREKVLDNCNRINNKKERRKKERKREKKERKKKVFEQWKNHLNRWRVL